MARGLAIGFAVVMLALAGFGLAACGGKGKSDSGPPAHSTFTLSESAVTITDSDAPVATVAP